MATRPKVDGHDFGSGTANIFICTKHPIQTFEAIKPKIDEVGMLAGAIAAYRDVEGEEFTNLWPEGSTAPFTYL